jgi:hypothetical protein
MLTEKDYCDYETCVALKELGYDELCEGYYHLTDDEDYNLHSFELCCGHDFQNSLNRWRVGAPMLYETQKWLREKNSLHIEVRWYSNMWYEYEVKEAEGKVVAVGSAFPTYEDALSTAVRMAVEYLKEK